MVNISVVVNALNAEDSIGRTLKSVKFADEIIVVDDGSSDSTVEIAKKYTNKIYHHKSAGYVEPSRNFALSKATGDWILLVDTDEEIPESLAKRLEDIAKKMEQIDYVEIPRKNLIFGKWMKASMWWPDYNIRFFKKGKVKWSNKIHQDPETTGFGIKLDPQENYAITHYHYESIFQFIGRLNRYTDVQASELFADGVKFEWRDLIAKPLSEFLGRYFANRGFEDGLHGLALSLLQAFSFLIVYLKLWEKEKFTEREISLSEIKEEAKKGGEEIDYWFKYGNLSKNPFKRFAQKVKNRLS